MIKHTHAKDANSHLPITEVTQAAFDALPTTAQPLGPEGAGSAWWREGDRIVRYTGRWGLYGDEVTSRQLWVVSS